MKKLERLDEILQKATVVYRKFNIKKGDPVSEASEDLPHISGLSKQEELVDIFGKFPVGVYVAEAEKYEDELVQIISSFIHADWFESGILKSEIAGIIGPPNVPQLIAIGKVLGLWDVFTPESFDVPDRIAEVFEKRNLMYVSGFNFDGLEDVRGVAFNEKYSSNCKCSFCNEDASGESFGGVISFATETKRAARHIIRMFKHHKNLSLFKCNEESYVVTVRACKKHPKNLDCLNEDVLYESIKQNNITSAERV